MGLTEAVDSRPGEIGNVSSAEQLNNADIAVVSGLRVSWWRA